MLTESMRFKRSRDIYGLTLTLTVRNPDPCRHMADLTFAPVRGEGELRAQIRASVRQRNPCSSGSMRMPSHALRVRGELQLRTVIHARPSRRGRENAPTTTSTTSMSASGPPRNCGYRLDIGTHHLNDAPMGHRVTAPRRVRAVGVLIAGAIAISIIPAPSGAADTTTSSGSSTTSVTTSPTASPATSTTIPRTVPLLKLGSTGPYVRSLQRRLSSLGYWLGAVDGRFGNLTQQAVYAIQKAASLSRDGVVGVATTAALSRGVRPHPRTKTGSAVEIDLRRNLLMIVREGKLMTTFNTSTGGGYSFTNAGVTSIARTPQGVFAIFRQVDALDISPLGELWRPKYFAGGYAIHGSASVPPFPVSHGCVRLSNQAMDWIWATNRMPIGTKVWIYY